MNSLPDGWTETKIRDLVSRTQSRDPRKNPNKSFRYVDVSSVSNSLFKIESASEVIGAEAPSRARKEIKTNDVLFATVRPTLKRIALVPQELDGEVASTGYCVLRPYPDKVVPEFLYHSLITESFIKAMGSLERGANYPAVRDTDVFAASIILPPLPEQRRIAHVLKTVQVAIEQQERMIVLTRELKAALMKKLFTEGLRGEKQLETEVGSVPEEWKIANIGNVAKFQSGGTPSRDNPKYWVGGTIPWVKTGEIDYKVIETTEEFITEEGLNNSAAKILPKGTLLCAMYGQGITRGRVAILGLDATSNQACAAITPLNEDQVSTWFLYYYMQFHYHNLRELGHGANQRNLNMDLIKSFQLSYPDSNEQKKIVDSLSAVDQKLQLIEQRRALLEELFRTLLHQLMTAKIRIDRIDLPEVS